MVDRLLPAGLARRRVAVAASRGAIACSLPTAAAVPMPTPVVVAVLVAPGVLGAAVRAARVHRRAGFAAAAGMHVFDVIGLAAASFRGFGAAPPCGAAVRPRLLLGAALLVQRPPPLEESGGARRGARAGTRGAAWEHASLRESCPASRPRVDAKQAGRRAGALALRQRPPQCVGHHQEAGPHVNDHSSPQREVPRERQRQHGNLQPGQGRAGATRQPRRQARSGRQGAARRRREARAGRLLCRTLVTTEKTMF